MKYSKFVCHSETNYRWSSSSDYAYEALDYLFTEHVQSDITDFIRWANDPKMREFEGNMAFMDKSPSGDISIYTIPLSPAAKEGLKHKLGVLEIEENIQISSKEFMHILQEWHKCFMHRYEEIWIKNDNGIFWVEGVR